MSSRETTGSPFIAELRRETAASHEAIEGRLRLLLDPGLDLHRYRAVLSAFYGYYAAFVPRLVACAASSPPDFPPQARVPWLERDLRVLEVSQRDLAMLPRCPTLPELQR